MSDLISRQAALDAVNDCGICIQKILDIPSAEERTAKVKVLYRDESIIFGHCECGQSVNTYDIYCRKCGARLEWK